MAKMSQTVKEIIQIVVFLIIVGGLVLVFVVYPLNRTKAILARPGVDDYDPDSLPANDVSAFADMAADIDTFRVDADGLTSLACVYLTPAADSGQAPFALRGTAILIHDERQDRTSMIPLARALLDSGLAVCLYDQRACALSSGRYHSDGEYEAADLTEVIAYLRIRDRIIHPFAVVGRRAGADAALIAAVEEQRLDGVIAIEPYITSSRWLDIIMAEHDMYWMPFRHTMFKFWYELRSDYAPVYRDRESLRPPQCRTLILAAEDQLDDEAVSEYVQTADAGQIDTEPVPAAPDRVQERILSFIASLGSEQ